ncbi:LacI family DNA-binding transcriptional regulator [Aerococcaceae bacterium zg-ZUI334]|uniref:LacI family DNA-binding transcriptional regulator n=1 Tax=Aerococcaceae bacterium zg-252 TaxID=2796928 RepID=UPI001B8DCD8E|nr:LacI family DNA-binding transcriptional regulator [Aerococcaceae bacterium zg-ZUI334]MBS4461409.1 LacI family DNA-binding transcriptional regulator [Aerococcaceae bacterium zg-B36]
MVTINDIAKRAGVAKSTVSRYLNGGSISQKTAEKINVIIKETGYVPNTFAQSLKAKSSKMIGAILPRLDSYASNTMLAGVENQLRKKGYRMTFVNTNLNQNHELEAMHYFQVTKMDGIIYLMTHLDDQVEKAMEQSSVPIVAIGQESPLGDSIYFNETQAGRLMADYLYKKGHRQLHFLKATSTDPAVGVYRKLGLKDRFMSYGDTQWVESECGFRMEEAYAVTKSELLPQKPTLIVGATDMMAIGAMRACLEEGYSIPDDISIAGFGNHATGSAFYPRLTTIDYPYYRAGEMAAEYLVNRIKTGIIETNIQLSTSLVERESVKDLTK